MVRLLFKYLHLSVAHTLDTNTSKSILQEIDRFMDGQIENILNDIFIDVVIYQSTT